MTTITTDIDRPQTIRTTLLAAYADPGLWGESYPARPLPTDMERGNDAHLAYLTLVYTISGGRDPSQLWTAARQTFAANPELFDPRYLAHARPADLVDRLSTNRLTKKSKSEATTWQRIGQALVMRAGGSVRQLLANNDHNARSLMEMLGRSKTTFPVLSGPQTAPRWLYGLATDGEQPLDHADRLPVEPSPAGERALAALMIDADQVTTKTFAPLDALGRLGCKQRKPSQKVCPVAEECPVARFCQYAGSSKRA